MWITVGEYLHIPLTSGFSPNWFWDFLVMYRESYGCLLFECSIISSRPKVSQGVLRDHFFILPQHQIQWQTTLWQNHNNKKVLFFYLLQCRILNNGDSILPDYCWKRTHHEGISFLAWLFYYILLQSAMRKRRGIIFLMLLQYINITYKAAKVELAKDQR